MTRQEIQRRYYEKNKEAIAEKTGSATKKSAKRSLRETRLTTERIHK